MSLFVGNISRQVSFKELLDLFGQYGNCDVDLKTSFAFVDYARQEDAAKALSNLHGFKLCGLFINVEWSKKSSFFDAERRNKHLRREDWYPSLFDEHSEPANSNPADRVQNSRPQAMRSWHSSGNVDGKPLNSPDGSRVWRRRDGGRRRLRQNERSGGGSLVQTEERARKPLTQLSIEADENYFYLKIPRELASNLRNEAAAPQSNSRPQNVQYQGGQDSQSSPHSLPSELSSQSSSRSPSPDTAKSTGWIDKTDPCLHTPPPHGWDEPPPQSPNSRLEGNSRPHSFHRSTFRRAPDPRERKKQCVGADTQSIDSLLLTLHQLLAPAPTKPPSPPPSDLFNSTAAFELARQLLQSSPSAIAQPLQSLLSQLASSQATPRNPDPLSFESLEQKRRRNDDLVLSTATSNLRSSEQATPVPPPEAFQYGT